MLPMLAQDAPQCYYSVWASERMSCGAQGSSGGAGGAQVAHQGATGSAEGAGGRGRAQCFQ